MEINGREVRFCRTVWANCQIADICEGGEITNVGTLLEGKYQDSQRNAAKFMAILSEGYEQKIKFADPEHKPCPLTEEEAMTLDDAEFSQAFSEALAAWSGEKPTVEAVPVKKTKKTRGGRST